MDDASQHQAPQEAVTRELKCSGCGAILKYATGTQSLVCTYCGAQTDIAARAGAIEEIDFDRFIAELYEQEAKLEVSTVKCDACGACVTFQPNVTADHCPYCAANIVVKGGTTSTQLKPRSLIPFAIDKKKATGLFQAWLSSRWFAPADLKARASSGQLDGVYIPYWTYDAQTRTAYAGERGTHYYVTESYSAQENGRTVTRTRQVRHTRWAPVSGEVQNAFDDLLVAANRALPEKYVTALEPWNLKALLPFNEEYLSGFRAQSYQVDVKEGLALAKQRMDPAIGAAIRSDIGGDEQRIGSKTTHYSGVSFKHVLLPLWISSYRYGAKIYRFLVNGQTGEVQGERPYAILTIILCILGVVAAVLVIMFLASN